jgi:hypothetical protein
MPPGGVGFFVGYDRLPARFAEPTHLNAFFKKMIGLTPQQFRER